jgi:hypothetical protein
MDDNDFSFSSDNLHKKKTNSGKIALLIISAILLIGVVAGGAYFLGIQTGSKMAPIPTPSLSAYLTSAPTINDSSPTAIPTITTSSLNSLTPTKKLTPTPTVYSKALILSSLANLDGFRAGNGGGNNSQDIRVGRNSSFVTRGFLSFDLAKLPTTANISKATLKIYQFKVTGAPYNTGGSLKIDHLTYGDSLEENDYGMPALLSGFETLSNDSIIGWKEIEVTDELKDDQANARSYSQYRLHFTTEIKGGTTEGDVVSFESGENYLKTGYRPQLIINYN